MTYEDLIRDMKQAVLLLSHIDSHYDHYKWSVDSLQYEIDYLTKHADPDEEVDY